MTPKQRIRLAELTKFIHDWLGKEVRARPENLKAIVIAATAQAQLRQMEIDYDLPPPHHMPAVRVDAT